MRDTSRYFIIAWTALELSLLALFLTSSSLPPGDISQRTRAFTRQIEFDYVGWMVDALGMKIAQGTVGAANYLPAETRRQSVLAYMDLVAQIQRTEAQINLIFADPQVSDPEAASAELRAELDAMLAAQADLQPLAEAVLQEQVAEVVADLGLTAAGQPLPPVLFHSTPLPLALIISPREVIRQEADISLDPNLSIEEMIRLEEQVDETLGVSSLVVHVGGVGVYPTMVQETSNLVWLSEVVAHEWIHNFLTVRPLGMNYFKTPALRTMNETAASIAGKEIGLEVLRRYYPERVPEAPPEPPPAPVTPSVEPPPEPVFDFYTEMGVTRRRVDELLAAGQVEEAEAYMEQRRVVFWEHGYRGLRKLNQAYFAFHGAYADVPGGGAAGGDPVGGAVRALRAQSPSLTHFIKRIAWMDSFEELQAATGNPAP